jgi:nitroreductase
MQKITRYEMNNNEMTKALSESLTWRYATKAYDPSKKISAKQWNLLKETLRLSPSSFGIQPWKFIDVQSASMRAQLAEAAPMNKAKFEGASNLLVVARLKTISPEYMDNIFAQFAAGKGIPRENLKNFETFIGGHIAAKSPQEQANWSAQQTYIAFGMFLMAAAVLHIDATPMDGIDPVKFDEILGLDKTEYGTIAALSAGYRDPNDQFALGAKVRLSTENVFKIV